MMLNNIAQYLQDMGKGSVGSSIFVTEMPREYKTGILLMDTYGGTRIDHELPGYRSTGFRLVVRSPDYKAGGILARSASKALTLQRHVLMLSFDADDAPIMMRQCLPVTDPKPYRRSDEGVWEFEVDVECVYIEQ